MGDDLLCLERQHEQARSVQVYRVGWDFSMLAPDDALADKLLPSGVANGAFAIHPIELSRQAVYQQFWRWWTEEYSC